MATTDGYGQRLGARLRVESAPTIVTRALRNADMAVTEIKCDNPLPRMSAPIQREDAFLVASLLVDISGRDTGKMAGGCRLTTCRPARFASMT
jgi:hypothetical protein